MKEIRDLATGLKEAMANIKKSSADARSEIDAEISRSQVNLDKVRSVTKDLKDANLEVESFLGDTGSNFSSSEETDTQQQSQNTDRNGVTRVSGEVQ